MQGLILFKRLPVNGMRVTSAGVMTIVPGSCAILNCIFFPHIGLADIRKLKTSQLLAPIKGVDASCRHDVAQRLQQRVTAIMRYVVQNNYI